MCRRTPVHATFRWAVLLILLAGGAAGAQEVTEPLPVPKPEPEQQQEPAPSVPQSPYSKLFARVSPGVVRIEVAGPHGGSFGSGFVLGANGAVVTNYHVIEGAIKGTVRLKGGSKEIRGVLGADPVQDLAVILIDPEGIDLHPLTLANELPPVGSEVAAIGHSLGFSNTLSPGIVSGLRSGEDIAEAIPALRNSNAAKTGTGWVQTTAPISPGNSGGPLATLDGRVVAVNTGSMTRGQNLNFAASVVKLRELLLKCETEPTPLAQWAEAHPAESAAANDRRGSVAVVPPPVGIDFAEGWMPEDRYRFPDARNALRSMLSSLRCSKCDGKGIVEVRHTTRGTMTGGGGRDYTTESACPDCGGLGTLWQQKSYLRLARLSRTMALLDAESCPKARFEQLLTGVRKWFREAAINRRYAADICFDNALPVLRDPDENHAEGVVFFGVPRQHYRDGDAHFYVVSVYGLDEPVLVRTLHKTGVRMGGFCLFGGVCTGTAMVSQGDRARTAPGVHAIAIERVR